MQEPAWKKAYYEEVILVDELRFLASSALSHYKMAAPGTALGEKKVVIQDGKAVIEIPVCVDRFMSRFFLYPDRGRKSLR